MASAMERSEELYAEVYDLLDRCPLRAMLEHLVRAARTLAKVAEECEGGPCALSLAWYAAATRIAEARRVIDPDL